jgi:ABC-type ATPase with predicted acetyltransferase domain
MGEVGRRPMSGARGGSMEHQFGAGLLVLVEGDITHIAADAIGNAPNGVVLVDEIENGLHHSVVQKVWRAIAEAARQFNISLICCRVWRPSVGAEHGRT